MVSSYIKRATFGRFGRFEDDTKDTSHRLIQHGFVQIARSNSINYGFDPPFPRPGHFQVKAALQGGHPIMYGTPVRDDQTFKPPPILYDLYQKPATLGTVASIKLIVR